MSVATKKKSEIWEFFTKNGSDTCICNLCGKLYKTGGGTTNLKNHLLHKHPSCITRISKNKNKPTAITISAKKSKTVETEEIENEANSVDNDLFEIVSIYIKLFIKLHYI